MQQMISMLSTCPMINNYSRQATRCATTENRKKLVADRFCLRKAMIFEMLGNGNI